MPMDWVRRAITLANVTRLAALTVIIGFFLPWGSVSCQGADMGTFSGMDLARGINRDQSGQSAGAHEPILFLVLVFAALILLVTLVVGRRWLERFSGDAGIFVLEGVSLAILYIKYRQLRDEARSGGAVLDIRYGAWVTFIAEIIIILCTLADVALWFRSPEAREVELPPEPLRPEE
jgi:hypothetical protein